MQTHRAPTASSSTVTAPPGSTTPVVLKLRGASGKQGKAVEWTEETIDNEGMGRKKSKICCIYHKPKPFDESSDESSSSSEEDSDGGAPGGNDDGRARSGKGKKKETGSHRHRHSEDCQGGHKSDTAKGKGNAYDAQSGATQ